MGDSVISPVTPRQEMMSTTSNSRKRHFTSRPLVYVTRRIPQRGVETLLKACDVKQWDSELCCPRGELLYSVVAVDGIVCMPSDVIDVDAMDAAGPSLRVIATLSSDTSHIDVAECERRGISVITIPDQPVDNLAELTVALMLLTIKENLTDEERIFNFEPRAPDLISEENMSPRWTGSRPCLMRRKSEENLAFQWSNGKPCNTECFAWRNMASKTFGIYGLTKLGQSLIRILKTYGVDNILVTDFQAGLDNSDIAPNSKFQSDYEVVPLDTMLEKAEIICVCGSVDDFAAPVFCRDAFKKMQSSSILITSQNDEKSIDYVDLYEALRDRQIKAAGLNDCNQEPVPFKTPLLGLKNCTFLPQTQESVYDMRHKMSDVIAKSVVNILKTNVEKMAMITE